MYVCLDRLKVLKEYSRCDIDIDLLINTAEENYDDMMRELTTRVLAKRNRND